MSIFSKFRKEDDQQVAAKAPVVKDDSKKVKDEDLSLSDLQAKDSKKETKPGKAKNVKKVLSDTGLSYKWLIKPIITEKATYLGAENKYVLEVNKDANKIEIKKVLKKLYNVDVLKVNVMNRAGRKVRYGKVSGQTKSTKKAIVTLKSGQSIDLYEGV
ncbi:MAG: 50S ribosomal protein L23 [Candidatus Komeilibacteria bacterium CG_4_9_14_0_8_um_filter_36_9]|uniref:Large ribosomal subunit protein uL23 n=2 Tax=Candidatus Komeiliibacteriota TaxID=1817908 RepID=A0A2M8DQ98_9BACT|nr:MAG: 50S ribosomal protein L23 [Candidatus Komeilibacteria bacterium CG_4_10_14_0_8_um_filter_37_78]PJC01142.1 MAG: 50S ribosomal protein L23 [Candidatus Komeilibacteria bacterium CG_4_9_14_0_8_um_filter_36_9]